MRFGHVAANALVGRKSARTITTLDRFATQGRGDMVAPFSARNGPWMTMDQDLKATLSRIAEALDRLAPSAPKGADVKSAEAYVWHAAGHRLEAVAKVNRVELDLLQGIDRQKETLLENTRRFAKGLPANNALLWGSRGAGKSSIVKAVHAHVNCEMGGPPGPLALIEIHREDIPSLPALLSRIRETDRRFVVFCDDLSFDGQDAAYKSLKAALDGDQSVRGGGGESLAVRPLRPVARLPQRRPGHLLRHHRGLRQALRSRGAGRGAAAAGAGMVGDARRAVRPRRLAVHPGSRR